MSDPAALSAMVSGMLAREGWAHASSSPVDADDPGRFHALFGRDSLIFALQVLPLRPDVATATLRSLAALQGTGEDPETEEQPGRILHEYRPQAPDRLVQLGWPVRGGVLRYYGSSDATSWFLVLLEATGDAGLQDELADARGAAARWLEGALSRGDGLVRCGPRLFPGGLSQQGWRDAHDPAADEHGGGIVLPDGSAPRDPLADLDSQAAAVGALDALVRLDADRADFWRGRAEELRARLAAAFSPELMALDGKDAPVPGAGSQLGWLLWADALPSDLAAAAAARLVQPDVLTAYGVRTLSARHPAFRPAAYHRGAVWPFDNWFAWGGLLRAGLTVHAEQVRDGVRRALAELGGHPELYAVGEDGALTRVPIANREQAWTLGAAVAFDLDWTGRRVGA